MESEDDDAAVLQREAGEAAVEELAVGGGTARVGGGRFASQYDDLRLEARAAPELVVDGVHQEAAKPRIEAIDLAQGGQVAPAAHQRLLGGVLRAVRVAQDQACDGVAPPDDAGRKDLEGIVIAAARPLDQLAVHGPSPGFGTTVVAALIP